MVATPANGRSRAVQLGAELRDARKRVGMTVAEVGERLGMHHTTVSRWERAERQPSEADTAAYLAILGVTGEDRERIVELARHDGVTDWVAPGIGRQLASLIEYERLARSITEVNPLLIPGLLQTRDYSRQIMIGTGLSRAQAQQNTMIRLSRQPVLTGVRPPKYTAVIGEWAVRCPACDRDTAVEQLEYLLQAATRPNITIHVMPMAPYRYTLGLEGRFCLLGFDRDSPVVQVDSYWSTSTLTNNSAVDRYASAAERICKDSLGEAESLKMIATVVTEMRKSL